MPEETEENFEETPAKEEPEKTVAEDTLSLGGSIELSGFRDVDRGAMVIVKKIVGSYAKTFSEQCKGFEKLAVHMKPVHEVEKSKKYEFQAMLFDSGKKHAAEEVDRNMFFALDSVLKKLEKMLD